MKLIRPEYNHLYHSAITPVLSVTTVGTSWLVDELWVEPKELEYLHYEEDVTKRFEELQLSQEIDTNSIDYARSQGVENEWEMMHFFASEDVNAPSEILQYVDDEGNLVSFTNDELEAIREWQPGQAYPVEGIQGHHIETVHENATNIELAGDSDNIILATDSAHLEYLHGGSYKNPTQDEYLDVKMSNEDRLAETLSYNESQIVPGFFEVGLVSIAPTALLGITIKQLVTYYQLQNSELPWNEKKKVLAKTAIFSTLTSSGIGALSYSTASVLDWVFDDLSVGVVDEFFSSMIEINGSLLSVQLATAVLSYVTALFKGVNNEQAFRNAKNQMVTALAEFAAFSAIGLGLELSFDMLGGVVMDALLPDPTGVLIFLNAGYKLFKLGRKIWIKRAHEQAYKECMLIRQNHAYQLAKGSLKLD